MAAASDKTLASDEAKQSWKPSLVIKQLLIHVKLKNKLSIGKLDFQYMITQLKTFQNNF